MTPDDVNCRYRLRTLALASEIGSVNASGRALGRSPTRHGEAGLRSIH